MHDKTVDYNNIGHRTLIINIIMARCINMRNLYNVKQNINTLTMQG